MYQLLSMETVQKLRYLMKGQMYYNGQVKTYFVIISGLLNVGS